MKFNIPLSWLLKHLKDGDDSMCQAGHSDSLHCGELRKYIIFGASPEQHGLVFHSKVSDLENQPELWMKECPYAFYDINKVSVKKY